MKTADVEKKIGDRKKFIRLINSITGIKSANLIGTKDNAGQENLAIVSSCVHLGTFPSLIGMIFRPAIVPRHSLENIQETKYFTINHVAKPMISKAHQTSGKYPKNISEFEEVGLEALYQNDFFAPFVKHAPVSMGLELREIIDLTINKTVMVIGEVVDIHIDEALLTSDGSINFEVSQTVGVGGLNHYFSLQHEQTLDQVVVSQE